MGWFSKGESGTSSSASAPQGDWHSEQLGEAKGGQVQRNGEQDARSPLTTDEIMDQLDS
jgi:hypothetical protein